MQNEIDLLIYDGQKSFPIEIKLSQSFHPEYKKTIEHWMQFDANPARNGAIVYCGEPMYLDQLIPVFPWYSI